MKSYLPISILLRVLLFLLLSAAAFAQAPGIQWQKSLGGSAVDDGFAIVQTTDGGYVSAGYSSSLNGDVTGNHGQSDYWVIKLDPSGNVQWKKCFGGTSFDYAQYIRQTQEGGYIITGYSVSGDGDITSAHGSQDVWVVKLDTGGTLEWQKSYGGSAQDYGYSIKQTTDKGYIVAGTTKSADGDVTGQHGGLDYWVLKLDTSGNLQWQKTFGGSLDELLYDIVQTYDGGYAAAGYAYSTNGDVAGNKGQSDIWVLKLDTAGNMQWQKNYGGTASDLPHTILQTADSGYMVAGSTFSTDGDITSNNGSADFWVLKLDTAGQLQWQKTYGSSGQDQSFGAAQTTDGGFVFTGPASVADGDVTVNQGMFDYWVVKTDPVGTIQWQRSFGGSNNDISKYIQETADGGFVIAGDSYSSDGDVALNQGAADLWLIKLDGITTSVPVAENSRPLNVYPNPAADNIRIKCYNNLALSDYKITDLSGRTILAGKFAQGTDEIDISGFAPGVYLLEIPGDVKQSFKIVKQ